MTLKKYDELSTGERLAIEMKFCKLMQEAKRGEYYAVRRKYAMYYKTPNEYWFQVWNAFKAGGYDLVKSNLKQRMTRLEEAICSAAEDPSAPNDNDAGRRIVDAARVRLRLAMGEPVSGPLSA